jgi:two-component system nitrogen regulation response regulator GlnG
MADDCANLPGMIGRHPLMRDVYRLVRRVANSDLPVVVVGETGTGKELVARAVHELGPSPDGPFVDLNCAGVPEALAEGELFGWERGAFTGAVYQKAGLLETADGGTLFLDEACSLPWVIQAKLLRAIEHYGFRRLGGRDRRTTRFRLTIALSTSVDALVADGVLRDDFAYRVAGITVALPPLRDRKQDVAPLAEHFLHECQNGGFAKRLEPDALRLLESYSWPGNVRELRTTMARVALLSEDSEVGARLVHSVLPPSVVIDDEAGGVRATLEACGWDVSRAARRLRIARSTLYDRMRKLDIRRPDAPSGPAVRPDRRECPIGQNPTHSLAN